VLPTSACFSSYGPGFLGRTCPRVSLHFTRGYKDVAPTELKKTNHRASQHNVFWLFFRFFLPTPDSGFPTTCFILPTSGFGLRASNFRLLFKPRAGVFGAHLTPGFIAFHPGLQICRSYVAKKNKPPGQPTQCFLVVFSVFFFRLRTPDFGLPTTDFLLRASCFQLPPFPQSLIHSITHSLFPPFHHQFCTVHRKLVLELLRLFHFCFENKQKKYETNSLFNSNFSFFGCNMGATCANHPRPCNRQRIESAAAGR
jgi:hypothetical protein